MAEYDYNKAVEIINKFAELQKLKKLDFKEFEDERIVVALIKYVEMLRQNVKVKLDGGEQDKYQFLIHLGFIAALLFEALAARCKNDILASYLIDMISEDIKIEEKKLG